MNIDFTEQEILTIGVITAALPTTDPEIEKVLAMISFKCLAAVDPEGAIGVIADYSDYLASKS